LPFQAWYFTNLYLKALTFKGLNNKYFTIMLTKYFLNKHKVFIRLFITCTTARDSRNVHII